MTIDVAPLAFPKDGLEPHMSKQTVEFHYEKHHKGYAKKLNKAIEGTKFEKMPLADIIRATAGDHAQQGIFNNAAQVWNHDFFWAGISPEPQSKPHDDLEHRIEEDFGGLESFKDKFVEAAAGRFGSGYAWLVLAGNELKIVTTANAETPIAGKTTPLLCCDVWEHAYYLDYQNERPKFLKAFVDKLIDWKIVGERYEAALRDLPKSSRAA